MLVIFLNFYHKPTHVCHHLVNSIKSHHSLFWNMILFIVQKILINCKRSRTHFSLLSRQLLIRGLKAFMSYSNHIITGYMQPIKLKLTPNEPQNLTLKRNLRKYSSLCRISLSLQYRPNVKVQYFFFTSFYSIILIQFAALSSKSQICVILQLSVWDINILIKFKQMNPFERLRRTIDNVNITYQFEQGHPQSQGCCVVKTTTTTNQQQLQKIKQIVEEQQISNIKQVTQQTAKMQQLQKALKRAEAVIENQMNEIVSLEKENQLLKGNLNQQYNTVVQSDQKERKYKEQIYRINVTVNELAVEINSERNVRNQLIKQIESLKNSLNSKNKQLSALKTQGQIQKVKLASELEERIGMFQLNVKRGAQQRKQFKLSLAKAQKDFDNELIERRLQIDSLKNQLQLKQKQLEKELINKKNTQQALQRQKKQHSSTKELNKIIANQMQSLKQKYDDLLKNQQNLQKGISSLASELQEQKKNVKVKVIQLRDETIVLQLQMYKRQCKELMQQKAIMRGTSPQYDRPYESQLRIMKG